MPDTIIAQFERTFSAPIEVTEVVSAETDRNNIASGVRFEGMKVYVVANSQTYILQGGLTNSDWKVYGNTGISGTFTTVDSKTVTVTNGLITSIV